MLCLGLFVALHNHTGEQHLLNVYGQKHLPHLACTSWQLQKVEVEPSIQKKTLAVNVSI